MTQTGHPVRMFGLIRSLLVYHAIPLRQRRLRRLYAGFAKPGDLAFDVGAHVGNRTRALAALGCRVVSVEPQPDFARLLRLFFRGRRDVTVIEAALGDRTGQATLAVSDHAPTMTTLATDWREARHQDPAFRGVRWNRTLDVHLMTLDTLADRFGTPTFIKLDVEGAEPMVLAGLSRPIRTVSFEYLPHALDYTRACMTTLTALGPYRFNWSIGESYELAARHWLTADELLSDLETDRAQRDSGDVYARLEQ